MSSVIQYSAGQSRRKIARALVALESEEFGMSFGILPDDTAIMRLAVQSTPRGHECTGINRYGERVLLDESYFHLGGIADRHAELILDHLKCPPFSEKSICALLLPDEDYWRLKTKTPAG